MQTKPVLSAELVSTVSLSSLRRIFQQFFFLLVGEGRCQTITRNIRIGRLIVGRLGDESRSILENYHSNETMLPKASNFQRS